MNDINRDHYHLLRLQKRIKIKQLAKFLSCTSSLISQFESKKCQMSQSKIYFYKYFIDNYENIDKKRS